MTDDGGKNYQVIENKLKSGLLTPRSKAYFALRSMAVGAGAVVIALGAVYVVSFVFFIVDNEHIADLARGDYRDYGHAIASLPWVMIAIALFLLIFLEIIGWHFTPLYRQPVLLSLILIAVLLGVHSPGV